MGHVGRLVGLAAVRHGRQVGAVGLDQAAVQRHAARHLAQCLGVLEAQDARERDVEAHVQRGIGHLLGFGEAVEHALHRTAALLAQHVQRVLARAARVHHQRQPAGARRADVHAKALALPCHLLDCPAVQPVVVQPGLADGHHARQGTPGAADRRRRARARPRCRDAHRRWPRSCRSAAPAHARCGTPPAWCRCTARGPPARPAWRARMSSMRPCSSGNVRWQCESTNMRPPAPAARPLRASAWAWTTRSRCPGSLRS